MVFLFSLIPVLTKSETPLQIFLKFDFFFSKCHLKLFTKMKSNDKNVIINISYIFNYSTNVFQRKYTNLSNRKNTFEFLFGASWIFNGRIFYWANVAHSYWDFLHQFRDGNASYHHHASHQLSRL